MARIDNLGQYAKKGAIPWNKGLKGWTKGTKAGFQKNKHNPNWKGSKVGKGGLHAWVRARLPKPKKCKLCGKNPPYDLANKSGKYLRKLSDWMWICRRCHMFSDGRLKKLIENYNKHFKRRGNQYVKKSLRSFKG